MLEWVQAKTPAGIVATGTAGCQGHRGHHSEHARANFHLNGTSSPGVGKGTEQPSSDPSEVVGIHSEMRWEQTCSRSWRCSSPVQCDNALFGRGIKLLRSGFCRQKAELRGVSATG
jgi:hypothetical protein